MEARVDLEGLKADDFHDVDLAAGWPPGGGDIVTEQPERRPQPFSRWNPNARFEAAVLLGKSPLALEARRGVIAPYSSTSDMFFPHSLDYKIPAFLADILPPSRVVFQLVVSPSTPASL